jgi:Tol biopolymer transport system component
MSRFDRLTLAVVAGLSVLLLSLVLWAFQTAPKPFETQSMWLYLVATASGETQVWQWNQATQETRQIAQLPGLVLEYAPIPHSARVIYPVERTDGGHDLWWVDVRHQRARQWLDCAPDDCRAVAPAPDGQSIVYTRVITGTPTLWWADLDVSETKPLFEEASVYGHYAAWSPDGARLAYVDSTGEVCIADLEGATDTLRIPALTEAPPVWSPDGTMLLVTDMRFEAGFTNHILCVDVTSGKFIDLSATFGVEDDAPVWLPDGQWIAFRRRAAGTAMGKQVWIMRVDGSSSHALTADTASHYGPPVWVEDGKTLLVTRHTADIEEIWAISIRGAKATLIMPEGYLPHRLGEYNSGRTL